MGKTYLRYVPEQLFGVISSAAVPIALDSTSSILFTPQCEAVGVWNVKRGIQTHALTVNTAASGDYCAKPEATCIASAHGSMRVAVGYLDGMIRVFDHDSGNLRMVLNGHRKAVTALQFDPSGMRLASGSKDTDIIVWDLVAESGICRLKGHKDEVTDVAFMAGEGGSGSPASLLVSTSKDTLIKVWNLSTLSCIQTVVGNRVEMWSACVLPTGDRLLAVGSDNVLRCWAVAGVPGTEGERLTPYGNIVRQTHERGVRVRCTPDGRLIGVQAAGKTVEVYRRRAPEELHKRTLRRLKRQREKLKLREKAKDSVIGGGGEGAAKLKEGAGGDDDELHLAGVSLADIDAYIAGIERSLSAAGGSGAAAGDGASSGSEGGTSVAIATDEFELIGIAQASSKISSFALMATDASADVLNIILSLNNNQLELHTLPLTPAVSVALGATSLTTPAGITVLQAVHVRTVAQQGHRSDVRSATLSSDNTLLLTASNNQAKVWNTKSGSCIRTLDLGDDNTGLCCAFGPGNRHALIGSKAGKILLFDLASGDLLQDEEAHSGAVWSLAMRPDGKGVTSGSADKDVKFWEFELGSGGGGATTAAKPKSLTITHARTLKLGDEVLCVKYSHHKDASKLLLAVSLLDSTVKVFFDDSLKFFLSLYGHKLPVMAMDISQDNTTLVTASADKNVKLWGLDFGDCHKSFFAHADSVMAVGFVANTHYFFTASKDKTIKYWDGDRFEHILTLEGHKGEVWALALASDGSFFVSGSHDRSIRLWRRTDEQLFLDEERERAMDALVEKDLRDADGEALLAAGGDAVGPLNPDGTARVVEMEAPVDAAPLAGAGMSESSAIVAHATKDTVKGTDRLLEALGLAIEETEQWQEYAQDVAAAAGEGEDVRKVVPPSRNPLLMNMTPAAFVLRTLRGVRPTDIDQVLLVLAFGDALHLLRYLNHLLRLGLGVELCTKAALLLIRVHQQQLVSNQTLLPLMASLKDSMKSAIAAHKDGIGFNIAGLRYLEKMLTESQAGKFSDLAAPVESIKPELRVGKRRKVVIF